MGLEILSYKIGVVVEFPSLSSFTISPFSMCTTLSEVSKKLRVGWEEILERTKKCERMMLMDNGCGKGYGILEKTKNCEPRMLIGSDVF